MPSSIPTVALVGRTNVGKSTLFNRLIERPKALVSAVAGTTRDRKEGECAWQGKFVRVIDTGGLDVSQTDEIERGTVRQALRAVKEADLILFLVDVKSGPMPQDLEIARTLQRLQKPILVVGNKAEKRGERMSTARAEWRRLSGLPAPIPVSALKGNGVGDLLDEIFTQLRKQGREPQEQVKMEACRLAVIGKPNVGKSSLLNAIIGEERFIVSAIAHTTREPNDTLVTVDDETFLLIDTAGMRKKSKTKRAAGLELAGVERTRRILKETDIALFVVDGSERLGTQERVLAGEIETAHVGIVLVANKWDLVRDKTSKTMNVYHKQIAESIPFLQWAPIIFTSAKTGQRVQAIFETVRKVREARRLVIPQPELDVFLQDAVRTHKPSKDKGPKAPTILGIQQVGTEPPVFEVHLKSRRVDVLHGSYLRFLENRLRARYPLEGTPIVFKVRGIMS